MRGGAAPQRSCDEPCSACRRAPLAAWMWAVAAVIQGLGCISPASAGTCALSGSSCICTDEQGGTWDVTSLTPAGNPNADTTVVARGACSGTYCQGTGFEYHVDFCGSLQVPQSCYSGVCCTPSDNLNMYRTDMRADCPPLTTCQCDKLGDISAGAVEVTTLQDGDGISVEFTPNSYYNSYAGWVPPVINLICDGEPSTAYEETSAVSVNPEVVNTACTTNYCSMVINWRTSAVCAGGRGWTIVILICVAAGLYVGGGVGYTRYEKGHWDSGDGGVLSAHPHWPLWQEIPDLVRDGYHYTKVLVSSGSVGSKGVGGGGSSRDEFDKILDEHDEHDGSSSRPASPEKEKRGRRKSEPAASSAKRTKKKKRKEKPRPSLPLITTDGDAEGKE